MFTVMLRRPFTWLILVLLAVGIGWAAWERYGAVPREHTAEAPREPVAEPSAPDGEPAPAPVASAPTGPLPESTAKDPPGSQRAPEAQVAAGPETGPAIEVPATDPRSARYERGAPVRAPASEPVAPAADPGGDPADVASAPVRQEPTPEVLREADAPAAAPERPEPAAPAATPESAGADRQQAASGRIDAEPEQAETETRLRPQPDVLAETPEPAEAAAPPEPARASAEPPDVAPAPARPRTEPAAPTPGEPDAAAPAPQVMAERTAPSDSSLEEAGPADSTGSTEAEPALQRQIPAAEPPPADDEQQQDVAAAAPAEEGAPGLDPDWSPGESLSLDSIRRALSALLGGNDEPAPVEAPEMPEPAAGPPEMETAAVEPAATEPSPQGPVPPSFDIVRVGPDGRAVIAGRAQPGTEVEIKSGEQVVDRVAAGQRGQWVATPGEPLKPGDHELTLVTWRAGERLLASDEVVVVVVPEPPPPQPAPVADSEPPPPQPAPVAEREPGEALAVALPRSGEGQGRILQAPGRISGDGQLALMVVDYDERGQTRLTGEAPPGAPVRIYVDNQVAGEVITRADGEWTTVLEGRLQPGTYTLRLDQLDREGKPVARLETPFTRVGQPPIEGDVQVDYVVVQPGNSLWRIARRLFGEGMKYVHVYEANRAQIRDPDLIYPGQVFEIPQELSAAG